MVGHFRFVFRRSLIGRNLQDLRDLFRGTIKLNEACGVGHREAEPADVMHLVRVLLIERKDERGSPVERGDWLLHLEYGGVALTKSRHHGPAGSRIAVDG